MNLRAVPEVAYVVSLGIPVSLIQKDYFREKARRVLPLWSKVLIAATVATVAVGAIVGPAVYFGLAGQFLGFVHFRP